MNIILKNIPAHMSTEDIRKFIKPALKGGLLSKSGNIESISIQKKKDINSNVIRHHGLIRITPDIAANRVIKIITRKLKKYDGCISADQYRIRLWHNDPRSGVDKIEGLNDRRQCNRRRGQFELSNELGFLSRPSCYSNTSRKYPELEFEVQWFEKYRHRNQE